MNIAYYILLSIFAISIDGIGGLKEKVRLPLNLRPIHYDWVIDANHFFGNQNTNRYEILGAVSIHFKVLETTDKIVVNQYNLALKETPIVLQLPTNKTIGVKNAKLNNDKELLTIYLSDEMLVESNEYRVIITYTGKISTTVFEGLYLSHCPNENGKQMIVTQGEADNARKYVPSFDEPSFKATFKVSIAHNENMAALSNGNLESQKLLDFISPSLVLSIFETTPIMSSYLLTIAVGNFVPAESATAKISNIPITTYTCPGSTNIAKGSAETAAALLDFFEKYFHETYKTTKLDQLVLEDVTSCAMENWGIITYSKKCLKPDIIAHELSHQWLGNLVTCDWWDSIWINEGLTNYMTELAQPIVDQKFDIEFGLVDQQIKALKYDNYNEPPLHMAEKARAPYQVFKNPITTLVYEKGASITKMIHNVLGKKQMQAVLRHFINKHRYSNANQHDLCLAIIEGSTDKATSQLSDGVDACMFLYSWTQQSGYPIITAKFDRAKGTVTVSQQPFTFGNSKSSNGIDKSLEFYMMQKWYVPIFYDTLQTPSNYKWLTPGQDNLTFQANFISNTPYIINGGMKGYYVVMYDLDEYIIIGEYLDKYSESIPDSIKVQIVHDYFFLLAQEYIVERKIELTFKMIEFIKNNQQVKYLFDQAMGVINDLISCVKRNRSAWRIYNALKKYSQELYRASYKDSPTKIPFPEQYQHLQKPNAQALKIQFHNRGSQFQPKDGKNGEHLSARQGASAMDNEENNQCTDYILLAQLRRALNISPFIL